MGLLTRSIAHHAVGQAAKKKGLDLKLGFALARDRRVSVGLKFAALVIGVGLTGALVAIEVPLEGVIGLLLPALGFIVDVAFDGIEFLVLPVIIGALTLPFLIPRELKAKLNLA